ncbi:MAG: hypothetical protein Q9163_000438 [Psora crenata]
MIALRLLHAGCIDTIVLKTFLRQFHNPHKPKQNILVRAHPGYDKRKATSKPAPAPKHSLDAAATPKSSPAPGATAIQASKQLSLYEELFPDEAAKDKTKAATDNGEGRTVPRLQPPKLEQEDGGKTARVNDRAKIASTNAFRVDNVALLVLQAASKSLHESDFRRIAPKGQHIKDWNGPGDILKVFPGRDPTTLAQLSHYFLMFPNPANARAYQHHILNLHRTAQTYTPTSIESPLPLQPGRGPRSRATGITGPDEDGKPEEPLADEEDGDIYALLRDYALCPPSQRLQLKIIQAPFGGGTRKLVENGGYSLITRGGPDGGDLTGRAVLFWVDGPPQPTTVMVENVLGADGRERDMPWDCLLEKLEPVAVDDGEDGLETELRGEQGARLKRWILKFDEADEARSFVRNWHRRVFPLGRALEETKVCAEILW